MNKENRKLNFVKVETTGFQSICNRLAELEEENQSLKLDNDFLQRQNNALKIRCSNYAIEIRELSDENAELQITKNLLGHTMTEEELKIEAAENAYMPYVGDDF